MTGALVVLATAPDPVTAERLATLLVGERLAACVNVVAGVLSIYRWHGEVQREQERLLIIKTTAERFAALRTRLVAAHPHDVPELLALPIADGYAPYLDWLGASVS